MKTKFYIVSGMSGAGKSQALKIFEDFGYICVDNMPLQMTGDFIDICKKNPEKYKNVAMSIDARAGKCLDSFPDVLEILKNKNVDYRIIFFNSDEDVLIKRYSETRRKHPLGNSVAEGISLERKILNKLFGMADEVIDTSNMTIGELKDRISKLTGTTARKENLNISVISFGYKYGVPCDADIIFDVRFITNPNYVHGLKFKTGRDKAVKDYIKKQKEFSSFFNIFSKLIENTLPGYIKEGKSYLTIAIGCTGGRHRSVFTAEELAAFLRKKKYKVHINHRDILRGR
ncbi:MAG: RNase adapter RapZ [Endomicrobia bacterium]|nr:RNase adapter RapZ [Endomicrobiia bacterium]